MSVAMTRARRGLPRPVLAERNQREVVPVEVVAEVEMTREARAGERTLLPGTVRALGADEPVDAALHGRARRPVGGQEPEERPGGLRRRALALPGERLVVVRGDRLAPAAVRVLVRRQPLDRAPHPGRAHVLPDPLEAGERTPRPVAEVDAPAAPPAAV